MGKTAHSSVVDGNCQVHGLENVYVAGSSVFPAGGVANPTYTIVALSLRLASHLAEKNLAEKNLSSNNLATEKSSMEAV